MVLNDYREQADIVLMPIAKKLVGLSPNTITIISLLFAVFCGISFAIADRSDIYLLLAFFLLFLSSLFDALDGKVARITNTASVQGDLLDHVFDRYSDIFILGGITFSPYCPMEIGFIAIISVLMLSYMGTQAQAVGGQRHYGGWLGRADRLMMLLVISLLQYILMTFFSIEKVSEFYLLGWLMIMFIFIGNLNSAQRLWDTWVDLSDDGGSNENSQPGLYKKASSSEKGMNKVKPALVVDNDPDDEIEWKGK